MIRLAGHSTQIFTSPTFTHSEQDGTAGASYVFNHGLRKVPESVLVYFADTEDKPNAIQHDFYQEESTFFGWTLTSINATSIEIRINRISSVSRELYVRCFVYS